MAILSFLFQLAGATMLLLFAVRLVRTGIERSYGASFQRVMTQKGNLLQSSFAGLTLAVVLQSSAAVALLTAGFAATGFLAFPTGMALVLGADLGSALIIQVLTFDLSWLVPVLLTVGGYLFVKTEGKISRQMGRIIMGIAFILISLRFLREAMDPIRDSAFLPAIAEYLARDYITAFLVGAALTFVMHSSVAAILMYVTLVQIGAIPFAAGLSLVLGANLGSALIPVWLSRGMGLPARQILMANLILRGSWAVLMLMVANLSLQGGLWMDDQGAQMLIMGHIAFNASLLLIGLPLWRVFHGLTNMLMASPTEPQVSEVQVLPESGLDLRDLDSPQKALTGLKRELLRMTDLVERMFRPSLENYRSGDKEQSKAIRAMDEQVNQGLSNIRDFVAAIPSEVFGKEHVRTAHDMMEYAVRLETAGDVVVRRLTVLADEMHKKGLAFSKEGWNELEKMHEGICENLKLATNVLISDDLESARFLSLEKTEIKRQERSSRKRHFKRLQNSEVQSFDTSDIHLETLRALREFNSHIAAVAYPILYQKGQLLETRLIDDLSEAVDE